jgi:D-methionine transport system permease protein
MNTQFWQDIDWQQIGQAATETLLMLGGSLVFVVLLGLPLGIVLFLTGKRQMLAQPFLHNILSVVVNTIRSIPFVILLIVLIPVTVMITGTSLGVPGAIPPLVIASTPFFSRLVEASLREVDRGVIEAVQGMGAKTGQLVVFVLLPEAQPAILRPLPLHPSRWFRRRPCPE